MSNNPRNEHNTDNHDPHYDEGYTPPREEYDDSDYRASYDDDPTEVIIPPSEGDDYNTINVDNYDFAFEKDLQEDLQVFHPNNVPGEFIDGDWVTKPLYENLYSAFSERSEEAVERISEYKKAYDEAYTRNEELETHNKELRDQAFRASTHDTYSETNLKTRQAQLDDEEREFEYKKAKEKWIKITAITLAVLMSIASIVLTIMLVNANSNADSSSKRGDAHQARISELEESLNSANTNVSDLTSENNDLKGKVQGLNNRVTSAEDLADEKSKEVDNKNKDISKLNDRIKELENAEPSTVTQTASVPPSTVTETSTLPGLGETVTETVTETATAE